MLEKDYCNDPLKQSFDLFAAKAGLDLVAGTLALSIGAGGHELARIKMMRLNTCTGQTSSSGWTGDCP